MSETQEQGVAMDKAREHIEVAIWRLVDAAKLIGEAPTMGGGVMLVTTPDPFRSPVSVARLREVEKTLWAMHREITERNYEPEEDR